VTIADVWSNGSSLAPYSGSWARWNDNEARWYTIGLEEEVMLLERANYSLAQRSDAVLQGLSRGLVRHTSPETHAAVVELATGVHADVAGATAELASLRERFADELSTMELLCACAGTHPLGSTEETKVSTANRYSQLSDTMRSLAQREPTMALHVHVGIPDQEAAIRVLNRLTRNLPVLLALSANSPFCQGRDGGFASMRTVIFGAFPRTGAARAFACYADYVEAIDPLIRSGAVPDPTFLWWDVRLQPRLGTVEVRVMDAQTKVWESASLAGLVQAVARLELEAERQENPIGSEVLAENRFLAARDGLDAHLIDPGTRKRVSILEVIQALLRECRPHAVRLGCRAQLEDVNRLAAMNGADRQRRLVRMGCDLPRLVRALAEAFVAHRHPA
jgi:glutamate---cysteine ligase / carboxylate-amine ligase